MDNLENFDFETQDKIPVILKYYPINAKNYIFSTILGNLLFSFFIIGYILKFFTSQRSFDKYNILILEIFFSIFTSFFLIIYLRLSTYDSEEGKNILIFNFYAQFFFLIFFCFYLCLFLHQIIENEIFVGSLAQWTIWEILMVFSPFFIILMLKIVQQYKYYFAMKQIE